MMSRQQKVAVAILSAVALDTTCELAHAQPTAPAQRDAPSGPAYTLEVDSDAPNVVSYEALAARIGSNLGGSVARPGAVPASRAAISLRYRNRELFVRAIHPGGRVLERTVKVEGEDAAVQRDAVLLAANLSGDEAREILDALAARPAPPSPAPAAPPAVKPAPTPPVDEGYHPVSVALFSPLATNYARPNVRSNFNLSFIYGRVGTIDGMQLGSAVVYTSRGVSGVQLAAAAAGSAGHVDGAQISGAANLAGGKVGGAQVGGALNLALGGMSGAQVAGAVNVSRDFSGLQMAGAVNVTTREFEGAQLSSVNVAGSVDGAQLGVINIAKKVQGTQIGVINIAEEVDGVALGVVNISKNSVHPVAWTSNLQYMNAGIKFSTKYAYTILGVHYGTHEGDFDNFGTTGAIGGHIPLPAGFDVEVQGSVTHLIPRPSQSSKDGNLWVAPQVIGGYSFARHLRVFAGGGVRLPAIVDLGREVSRPEVLAGVQF
jgi:hypothetical protein